MYRVSSESFVPRLEQYIRQIEPSMSLSIGVKQTDHVEGYIDATTLIHEADARMYQVKKELKTKI